jgi:cytochrome c
VAAIVLTALAPVPNVNSAGGKVEIRLDSATGVLVGETEHIQPQAAMGPPSRLRATIRPTAGVRDVYFVFRNEQAKEGQNLLVLFTAAFERRTGSR